MPCCALQVAALVVWFATIAGFYALFVPVLPSYAWQVATAVGYTVATAAIFVAYFVVRYVLCSSLSSFIKKLSEVSSTRILLLLLRC